MFSTNILSLVYWLLLVYLSALSVSLNRLMAVLLELIPNQPTEPSYRWPTHTHDFTLSLGGPIGIRTPASQGVPSK